jgi:N-acetylglucosaminyldiphosphoundecaprenol N-acetyl-beta-D-mannosaminyltransferase
MNMQTADILKNANSAKYTTTFLDYAVYSGALPALTSMGKILVSTINQYSYCIAELDAAFKQALLGADVLLPDGVAITGSVRFLSGKKITKIAGADLHQYLLEYLNAKSGSCFYLGSSEATLQKIRERLAQEYPQVKVATYSPPYKPNFSAEDSQAMIEAVHNFQPEVLFVGMTAPKQEKWAYEYHAQLSANITCCIGAVFDFYAGSVHRPSPIWIKLGLEWLGRLLNEPKRLWKRYLYYGPIFVWRILQEKFKKP